MGGEGPIGGSTCAGRDQAFANQKPRAQPCSASAKGGAGIRRSGQEPVDHREGGRRRPAGQGGCELAAGGVGGRARISFGEGRWCRPSAGQGGAAGGGADGVEPGMAAQVSTMAQSASEAGQGRARRGSARCRRGQ